MKFQLVLIFTVLCGLSSIGHGQGLDTGIGLTSACAVSSLVGRTYSSLETEISFLPNNKATYAVAGDRRNYVVNYSAFMLACLVILQDPVAPGLSQGREFNLKYDMSKMYDEQSGEVLIYQGK